MTQLLCDGSELADETNLGLEHLPKSRLYGILEKSNQRAHVGRRCSAPINDDVGVQLRDPSVSDSMSLEATLIDESASANAFNLLEYRASAWFNVEYGVPRTAPLEVFERDSLNVSTLTGRQTESAGERNLAGPMQSTRVVAEVHLGAADACSLATGHQEFDRLDELCQKNSALARGRWRQKVQVLPERATHRAWNAHKMFETREAATGTLTDQITDNHPGVRGHAVTLERHLPGGVPNHQATNTAITNQDVCTKAQDHPRNAGASRSRYRVCEIGARNGIVHSIGGSTNPECGERRKRDAEPQPISVDGVR